MNSQDQMSVYQELYNKGWLGNSTCHQRVGERCLRQDVCADQCRTDWKIPWQTRNRYLRKAEYRNTDWFKELFQNTFMHTHSVSLSFGYREVRRTTRRSAPCSIRDGRRPARCPVIRPISMRRIISSDDLTLNLITNGSYRKQNALRNARPPRPTYVIGRGEARFRHQPLFVCPEYFARCSIPKEYLCRATTRISIFSMNLANNYIDLNVADVKFQGELKWKAFKGFEASALASVRIYRNFAGA